MKIGFCGSISVGKTTLVKKLSKLPEFKDYKIFTERSKYLRDIGIPLDNDSTLKGQTIFLAERCTELFQENMITDRSVIDVMAFTKASKEINYIHKEGFVKYAAHFISDYDFIFYIDPEGVPLEKNGVRSTDKKYREEINTQIKFFIDIYHPRLKNFHTIKGGSVDERVEFVLDKLKKPNPYYKYK